MPFANRHLSSVPVGLPPASGRTPDRGRRPTGSRIVRNSRTGYRLWFALVALLLASTAQAAVRIKELTDVQGVRDNDLFGYGLVVGLAGTGDSEQVLFTEQSIAGMLGRIGIRIDPKDIRSRNVAAVMVTTRLPGFARSGSRLDISVGSLGNARSLAGGVLLITPLTGPDGRVYAVAQGPVQVGGYEASGRSSYSRKNTPTSGVVPGGALVEQAVITDLSAGPLVFGLRRPDFTTAARIAAAVNGALGADSAKALDPAAVEVKIPDSFKSDTVGLVAKLEALEVEADQVARVVVSERTGTVVAGERVRLRPVAVAHGGIRVSLSVQPQVSQPAPFNQQGRTVVSAVEQAFASEESRGAVAVPATSTVEDLAKALNLLGATPRDLIAILEAMKAAGALDAELEVM
jgi:flagellar P-ring protein FlgI